MTTSYRRIALFCCIALSGLVTEASVVAQTVQTLSLSNYTHHVVSSQREAMLYIARIDFDSIPDTVMGRRVGINDYMLSSVRWGVSVSRDTSDNGRGGNARNQTVSQTVFLYPKSWLQLQPTVSLRNLNRDSTQDILLFLHFTELDSSESPPTLTEDMKIIAIPGQDALKSMAVVCIDSVLSDQETPFVATHLSFDNNFSEPAIRDLSGRTSYAFVPLSGSLQPRDNSRQASAVRGGASPNSTGGLIRIFPNPTPERAIMELTGFPVGEYTIEIVGTNGMRCCQQILTVASADKGVLKVLDVHTLPSGYYFIRAYNEHSLYRTYRIIVVR